MPSRPFDAARLTVYSMRMKPMTSILITLRNAQTHAVECMIPSAAAMEMGHAGELTGCLIEAVDALLARNGGSAIVLEQGVPQYSELPAKLRVVFVSEYLSRQLTLADVSTEAGREAIKAVQDSGLDATDAPILASLYVQTCEALANSPVKIVDQPTTGAGWMRYFLNMSRGEPVNAADADAQAQAQLDTGRDTEGDAEYPDTARIDPSDRDIAPDELMDGDLTGPDDDRR